MNVGYLVPKLCEQCGAKLYPTIWEVFVFTAIVFAVFTFFESLWLSAGVGLVLGLALFSLSALFVPLKVKEP
jgi:hypothetical protein